MEEISTDQASTSGESNLRQRSNMEAGQSSSQPEATTSKSSENNEESKRGNNGASAKDSDDGDGESDAKAFECNICLDVAKDAVVSHCGHLFCWPCLHQWLETRPNRQSCPVCKAAISRDKVIPLYGRGGSNEDPRSKVPPRPTPNRQEQPEGNRFTWGNNEGDGRSFHLSFGIGAFPFGFFASALNWGQPGPFAQPTGLGNAQPDEQEMLSKVFLYVAVVFIIWLFLA